jgi:branched-chain amino acid aminotransferase
MRKIWKNGKILPESEAKVSVYDSALMFGDMVFEMTRSFKGIQFRLERHLERLMKSANYVGIPLDLSIADLQHACVKVQEANKFPKGEEHRLMINVSRGILPMYSETEGEGTNIIITDFPVRWTVAGMGQLFDSGINAVTPSQRAIPAKYLEPKVKCRSRLHFLKALMEVAGYEGNNNWPLLLDEDGYIAEGPGYNFFVIFGNVAITPHLRNVLSGISREFLFEIVNCGMSDMNVYDVLSDADEAFFTATPFCMIPVTSINGQKIGDGKVGSKFKKILKTWSCRVGVNIEKQIKDWDKGAKEGVSTYQFKGAKQ